MLTDYLLEQSEILKDHPDPFNYYMSISLNVKTKNEMALMQLKKDPEIKVLFVFHATAKINFLEFSFGLNALIDLSRLVNEWGDYKLVDESIRDNMSLLIFRPPNNRLFDSIEIITRSALHDDSNRSQMGIEAARFL